MDTRLGWAAYLTHLELDSRRFADVLAQAEGQERVPTCPKWDADDLLYHLAEVQDFWAHVVGDGVVTDAAAEAVTGPARADTHAGLVDLARDRAARLLAALRGTDPAEVRWTWSTEQTAGFTIRRQAHEALIHRLDAELTMDERTPLDPGLATDGVDEGLRVMYAGCPPWGTITPVADRTVRIVATDTEASWIVTLARFTGTDPEGTSHDDPDIVVSEDEGSATLATISGTAEDLDCWIWHRPARGEISRSGDDEVLGELDVILAHPLN